MLTWIVILWKLLKAGRFKTCVFPSLAHLFLFFLPSGFCFDTDVDMFSLFSFHDRSQDAPPDWTGCCKFLCWFLICRYWCAINIIADAWYFCFCRSLWITSQNQYLSCPICCRCKKTYIKKIYILVHLEWMVLFWIQQMLKYKQSIGNKDATHSKLVALQKCHGLVIEILFSSQFFLVSYFHEFQANYFPLISFPSIVDSVIIFIYNTLSRNTVDSTIRVCWFFATNVYNFLYLNICSSYEQWHTQPG